MGMKEDLAGMLELMVMQRNRKNIGGLLEGSEIVYERDINLRARVSRNPFAESGMELNAL